jgi:hypothetical protein
MGRYMVEYPKIVPVTGLSVQMDVVLQILIGPSCVGRTCSLRQWLIIIYITIEDQMKKDLRLLREETMKVGTLPYDAF